MHAADLGHIAGDLDPLRIWASIDFDFADTGVPDLIQMNAQSAVGFSGFDAKAQLFWNGFEIKVFISGPVTITDTGQYLTPVVAR